MQKISEGAHQVIRQSGAEGKSTLKTEYEKPQGKTR